MAKQRLAPDADEHVLDRAADLFRDRGFEATTVRDIARAAGMLPGSLHYRYPTKGSLLLALMRRSLALDMVAIEAALAEVTDPAERLRVALRTHITLILMRDSTRVVLFEWRSIESEAQVGIVALRDQYEAYWSRLLDEAQRAGTLAPTLDLKLLRLMLFGAANWVSMWYSPGGERTPEEIADAFWNFLAGGILNGHTNRTSTATA